MIPSDSQRGPLHFSCSLNSLWTSGWGQTGKILSVEPCLGLLMRRIEAATAKTRNCGFFKNGRTFWQHLQWAQI